LRLAAGLLAALLAATPAAAGGPPHCAPLPLWGDGRHDDTLALNAWLHGETVRWADTGGPIGAEIDGRVFVLSGPVYVEAGTGRTLTHFRMFWPRTGERLQGGTIAAGDDPDAPPRVSSVAKTGGDPGEGVPFEGAVAKPRPPAECFIS
jgi:hypothetical protein